VAPIVGATRQEEGSEMGTRGFMGFVVAEEFVEACEAES
jgi:hypothetical protein